MTLPAPTYDLVLLLDPQAEDDVRAKLVADARAAITAQGELLRHDEWGERALSYPIERRSTARYHLLQFHAGSAELLQGLDRTLHLADEVLRFRIIKLAPGVPAPPDMGSPSAAARPTEEAGEPSAPAPAPPVADSAPAPAAAAPEPATDAPEPETDAPEPAAVALEPEAVAPASEAEPGAPEPETDAASETPAEATVGEGS